MPQLGWEMEDFDNFINRSETDTAWESYQSRRKSTAESPRPSKRTSEDDLANNRSKRPRSTSEHDQDDNNGGPDYSLLVPVNASVPPTHNSLYPGSTRSVSIPMYSLVDGHLIQAQRYLCNPPPPYPHLRLHFARRLPQIIRKATCLLRTWALMPSFPLCPSSRFRTALCKATHQPHKEVRLRYCETKTAIQPKRRLTSSLSAREATLCGI